MHLKPFTQLGYLYIPRFQKQLPLSLSVLAQPQTFCHVQLQTIANMGKLTAKENTLAISKSRACLSSFKLVNLPWTLTSPHTYKYTHSAIGQSHTSYVLFSSHAYIHTHIYVSRTCYLLTSCLNDEHTYTQICSNNTHLYSHNSCIIHAPHTQIPNRYIRTLITFPSLFCGIKFTCFNILVVVKFPLSTLFIFFVLLIVERHSELFFFLTKTPREQNPHSK